MSNRNFSKEEYLDLVTQLTDEQYDALDDYDLRGIEDLKSFADKKCKAKENKVLENLLKDGVIDLTQTKKDKIKESIFNHNTIKIYDFLIRITSYRGEPNSHGANLAVNVTLYHEQTKTELSGRPCQMTVPFNICKDDRFTGRPWLSYFSNSHGKDIPIDVLVEIIRWMQVVKKLSAFA